MQFIIGDLPGEAPPVQISLKIEQDIDNRDTAFLVVNNIRVAFLSSAGYLVRTHLNATQVAMLRSVGFSVAFNAVDGGGVVSMRSWDKDS